MTTTAHVTEALRGSPLAAAKPAAGERRPIALPVEPLPEPQTVMRWAGFPEKYRVYSPDEPLENAASEAAVQQILADLPQLIAAGTWLYLLGAPGVGKTGVMVRMMHRLPLHRLPLPGPQWVHSALVRYRLGSTFATDLQEWHEADGERGLPPDMTANMDARVLFIDDACRMLQIGGFQRENVLYRWDQFTELRDGRWLTVVSANVTAAGLEEVPQFRRGLDRARERGQVLEIPGRSRRGRGREKARS